MPDLQRPDCGNLPLLLMPAVRGPLCSPQQCAHIVDPSRATELDPAAAGSRPRLVIESHGLNMIPIRKPLCFPDSTIIAGSSPMPLGTPSTHAALLLICIDEMGRGVLPGRSGAAGVCAHYCTYLLPPGSKWRKPRRHRSIWSLNCARTRRRQPNVHPPRAIYHHCPPCHGGELAPCHSLPQRHCKEPTSPTREGNACRCVKIKIKIKIGCKKAAKAAD